MTDSASPLAPVRLPARAIPVPDSISAQARAALSQAAASVDPSAGPGPWPAPGDLAGWADWAEGANRMMEGMRLDAGHAAHCASEAVVLGGVPAWRLSPTGAAALPDRIVFDIHGGALIAGWGEVCRLMAARTAGILGAVTYAPDYRMPPRHPYPTPLDDCEAAYLAVRALHPGVPVVVCSSSAGGNLAAALMFRLRDAGVPFPDGLILQTPEVDLTESGDSFQCNMWIDVMLRHGTGPINALYANGHDLADPFLSPLFGDFGRGFPRTLISTGTRDLFLSNSVRMHNALRRAGVPSELIVVEAMPHGGFGDTPEDRELAADLRRFAESCWRSG